MGLADAEDLCAEVYRSREAALAVARQLRSAGWIVPLFDVPTPPRDDGSRVVGVVYHPDSFESPGELMYTDR